MKKLGLFRRALAAVLAVAVVPLVALASVESAGASWIWQPYDAIVKANADLGVYWRMNPPSTPASEGSWSISGVSANSVGSTDSALAADPTDQAGVFSGSSDVSFTAGPMAPQADTVTAEAWLRTTTSTSTNAMVLSEGSTANPGQLTGVQLGVRPDGTPFGRLGLFNSSVNVTTPAVPDQVADGRWHHLVLTYNADGVDPDTGLARPIRLYVDGQLASINRPPIPMFIGDQDWLYPLFHGSPAEGVNRFLPVSWWVVGWC